MTKKKIGSKPKSSPQRGETNAPSNAIPPRVSNQNHSPASGQPHSGICEDKDGAREKEICLSLTEMYDKAMELLDQDNPDRALERFERLAEAAVAEGDPRYQQEGLHQQAIIHHTQGNLDGAMRCLEREEVVCRTFKLYDPLQQSLGVQAEILQDQGNFVATMARLGEQQRFCRQIGNDEDLIQSLRVQADILYDHKDLKGAYWRYKEVAELFRERGAWKDLQEILDLMAIHLALADDYEGAMEHLVEQQRICQDIGHTEGLVSSLINQGAILAVRDDFDAAITAFTQVVKIYRDLDDAEGVQTVFDPQAVIFEFFTEEKLFGDDMRKEMICNGPDIFFRLMS